MKKNQGIRDIILFIVFVFVSVPIFYFDMQIMLFLGRLHTSYLDSFFYYYTTYGNYVLAALYGVYLLLLRNKEELRRWAPVIIVAYASWFLSGRFVFALKNIFMRKRPLYEIPSLPTPCGEVGGYSFPSGHSQSAWALLTPVYLETKNRLLRVALLVFGVLMSFSRVYCSVHYVTDVIWGAYIGYMFSSLLYWTYRKNEKENVV